MSKLPSRTRAIVRMVLLDAAAFGACLVVFAYFHHVRITPLHPTALPEVTQTPALETPAPNTPAPDATPSPTPEPTGLLGAKYAEKFSDDGTILDASSYRSESVAIELRTEYAYDSVVHVADIYIQGITSFRTGVYDAYGSSPMLTLKMAQQAGAIVAISGDYFSAHMNHGMLIIRNGQIYVDEIPKGYDTCVLYYDGVMETISDAEFDRDAILARNPYQAWCFGPALLGEDGAALTSFQSTIKTNNPRSAIGYFEPGHYCFVMVEGRSSKSEGMTLQELSSFFAEMGCKAAYNLDGGKTAEMVWNNELVNARIDGGRSVSDILYIIDEINAGMQDEEAAE